jgi:two-component system, OmpR family, phosphate regulon sensor histidine kinase PhoR
MFVPPMPEEQQDAKRTLFPQELNTRYIGKFSHDMKTPLSIIMMQLELMQILSYQLEERLHPLVEIAMANSEKLSRLIGIFSDLLNMQLGCLERNTNRIDLIGLFQEICLAAQRYAEPKAIRIEYKPQTSNKAFFTDAEMLGKILLNLLSNAIKFTPEKGVIIVSVKVRHRGTAAIFVHNTGAGMPASLELAFNGEKSYFDSFYDMDMNGWGLSVIKSFVHFLGGSAHCRTRQGQGSTFMITLPCLRGDGEYNIEAKRSLNLSTIVRQELSGCS